VIKPLSSFRHLRIAGFAIGAVAVTGAAVLVTAWAAGFTVGMRPASHSQPAANTVSSLDQAASASTVCSGFISHLASDLGKSQSQVNAAVRKAIGETLADEVKDKQITQAQADAIKQRLAGQPPCSLAAGLGKKPRPVAGAPTGAYMQQLLAAAASALNITPAKLQADLASGSSLSQIASAQNPPVTEAQFRTKLIAQIKPLLDTAVTNKKLTAAQEQTILQRLQSGPIQFWNKPIRKQKPPVPPGASATPAPATIS
jgi:hypothetical protein